MSERARAAVRSHNPDRWMAEIFYAGQPVKIVAFEELEHLDEIIERGPDWNTIERIVITLNRPSVKPRAQSEAA